MERIKTYGCSDVIVRLGIAKYRQYCEGVLKHHMDGSLLAVKMYDGLCWYYEGTARVSSSVVMELCLNRVIEADVDSHALLRVNGEEVNDIEQTRVLDLGDDGEDGKEMCFAINPMVGVCCTTVRTERCMRDSDSKK